MILILPLALALSGNSYAITLTDPDNHSLDLFYDTYMINHGNFRPLSSIMIGRSDSTQAFQVVQPSQTTIYVLYDLNPKISTDVEDTSCQVDASPLVVDTAPFTDDGHGLNLTSPADGVLFDILGAHSFPAPYTKKQISWTHNTAYMFVTLPDKNGQITGINQLFGNNTKGPDGKFAANGFLALAKYDLNHDGVIDAKDPVFTSLRLWSDQNFDGVAQSSELHSLSELGIQQINVRYNRHFSEQDQYGNLTKFESTVQYVNGQVRKIFDIWFAIH